jgi:hypothetical protein
MDHVIREGFGVIDVFRRYLADDDSIDQLSIALYGKRKYVFQGLAWLGVCDRDKGRVIRIPKISAMKTSQHESLPSSGQVDIEPAFDLPMPVSGSLVSALMPPFLGAFGRRRLGEMPLLVQRFLAEP